MIIFFDYIPDYDGLNKGMIFTHFLSAVIFFPTAAGASQVERCQEVKYHRE